MFVVFSSVVRLCVYTLYDQIIIVSFGFFSSYASSHGLLSRRIRSHIVVVDGTRFSRAEDFSPQPPQTINSFILVRLIDHVQRSTCTTWTCVWAKKCQRFPDHEAAVSACIVKSFLFLDATQFRKSRDIRTRHTAWAWNKTRRSPLTYLIGQTANFNERYFFFFFCYINRRQTYVVVFRYFTLDPIHRRTHGLRFHTEILSVDAIRKNKIILIRILKSYLTLKRYNMASAF